MSLFKKCKKIGWMLVLLAIAWACGSSNTSDPEPDLLDRQPILTNWADNIILPAYAAFKAKQDVMITAANAFTANPTTTSLVDFRNAWVNAYTEWQKVELFEIGPADKYTMRSFFNIYPADEAGIKQNILNPSANLALPDQYARQGFPALDYFINGLAATDTEIIVYYTTDADASKRIAYIRRLTERMSSILGNVISEWTTYRETFVSKTGLDIGSPMGLMVNAYVLNYERYIRSGKFGIPSGAMASGGGAKHPEKVEAFYKKDISATLAKAAHQASVDFFNGKSVLTGQDGPSFKSYLDALGAKDAASGSLLSALINTQFAVAITKLNALSPNLYNEVQANKQVMVNVYTEMQKAVRMLKVDMTSAMSITITYTDNDGD